MDTFGWQGTLLVVGGLFLQAIVCGAMMRPVEKPETHKSPQDVISITQEERKPLGVQSAMLVAGVMFIIGDICMEIGYRVYVIFTAMRCDMLGISKTETSWLYTIFGIVGLPAKPLAGLIGDRPEVNRTYMYGICVALAGSVILVTTAMKTFQILIISSVLYALMSGNFGYRASIHKADGRLTASSHDVSKPPDLGLHYVNRCEIWQVSRQCCCRSACHVSTRYDHCNIQSRGTDTSRDLTVRCLTA